MPAPVLAPPPKPAAPAPKPSAAPPEKPSGDAAPVQPIEKAISFDEEIDADLASLDDDNKGKQVAKPKPKPIEKPEKPEEDQEPNLDDEPKTKPDAEPVKPVKAADLRTAYEGLKKRVKDEFEPKVAKLEARIKELESSGPETVKPIMEELEAKKKRLDELESKIKFADYKESTEFKEKYEKPYQEAWKKASKDLEELTIPNDDGTTRQASAADLLQLANLPLGEARAAARQMFGDAADDVMAHRRVIRELSEAQTKALEDAKTNATEREKKLAAQRQIEHQEVTKMWTEANKALSEKYPLWFAESEGDTEGNELLRKGFSLADLHFVGVSGLKPEQIDNLPPRFRDAIKAKGDLDVKDRIALDAILRNKIASHTRLASSLKKSEARIKELEKALAEYEGSEPPAGKAGGKTTSKRTDGLGEAMEELDAIDRKNQ